MSRSKVRVDVNPAASRGPTVRLAAIRCGAVSAVVAGGCWVVKAGGILLTGQQLAFAFEAAFILFPVALVGLYAALGPAGGRLATYGLVLAVAAETSAVVVGLGALIGPDRWTPREDTVTVLTPFIVLRGLGTFAALLLLGPAARPMRALPGRWRSFPLAIAVSAVPLMVIGGALELVSERLLEVPLVVLGGAWIALGVVLAGVRVPAEVPAGGRAARPTLPQE